MPSFGRLGKQNNRSQHTFESAPGAPASGSGPGVAVSSAAGAAPAANPQGAASASPNTAFSSNESFDVGQQPQQQQQLPPPPPPPHSIPVYTGGSPVHAHAPPTLSTSTSPPGYDSRAAAALHLQQQQQLPPPPPPPQKQPLDFAEQVSRSQSQRYPHTPLQPQHHYGPASTSADDLSAIHQQPIVSPLLPHGQPIAPVQPVGLPVPEPRRSTRKLIKNILGGSSRSDHPPHHAPPNPYDNTQSLARRPSKRISQQPPTIRTGGVSQVSLDQQPLDWPPPPGHLTQPSPLQGVGDFTDNTTYTIAESNQETPLQDPHGLQHPTLRRVPTDQESSPFGHDDLGAAHRQQAYHQPQGQASPDPQQTPYGRGQVQYENPPQYQYQNIQPLQYQGQTQQGITGHLSTTGLPHQNADTVSQLSHDSPVTDTDQHSAHNLQSTQTSPAVNYPPPSQTQPLPGHASSPNPAQAQPNMPPAGGQPPARRSQEAEKSLRGAQVEPPPGPPPGYRHSQATNMNPLPPPPPGQGGQPPGTYRQSSGPERQFEGAQNEGRNSPQPSASDRDAAGDPEKAMKELGNVDRRSHPGTCAC